MKRVGFAVAIVLATIAAPSRPGADPGSLSHHPGFHHHPGAHFTGGIFWDPFFYPYYYPYYVPYPYPVYAYPPEPEEPGWGSAPAPEAEEGPRAESGPATREDALRASYGLVQMRGVPDGASVELDGRFWLIAEKLDQRWLAVPYGEHTLRVQVRGAAPVERRITVASGKNQVVRFGPFRSPPA